MPSIRKIIDLSQPVYHNCPGWPTYEMVDVRYEAIYPNDGYTAERIQMNVHTATHLDATFHFYPEGKTIEQIPIDRFQGEAVPVDLFGIAADTPIGVKHLEPYKDVVRPGDIVLLCTGWGKKRGYTKEYYHHGPTCPGKGLSGL